MKTIHLSKDARKTVYDIARSTNIYPYHIWARAALGYSLGVMGNPDDLPSTNVPDQGDSPEEQKVSIGGFTGELKADTFWGSDKTDEMAFMALLRQREGRTLEDEDVITSLIKAHVERGLRYFCAEFARLGRRGDEFVLSLLEEPSRAAKAGQGSSIAQDVVQSGVDYSVRIILGKDVRSGMPVETTINGKGQAPHIAIMGKTGTGKSRTGLGYLASINEGKSQQVPCLIFDYLKGDIAREAEFKLVRDTLQAKVIDIEHEPIPLSPFALPNYSEESIRDAAYRFWGTLKSVMPQLKEKQRAKCVHIVRTAYGNLGRAPSFVDLWETADMVYPDPKERDSLLGSLYSELQRLADYKLFQNQTDSRSHPFYEGSYIINLSTLPEELRKAAVFLTLDHLFPELMARQNAPLDANGFRQIRLIIALDEAQSYLECKNPTLAKFLSAGRSKGVAVMLLSQRPDDFDQPKVNYTEQMGLKVVFRCDVNRPRAMEVMLGGEIDPQQIASLQPGIAKACLSGSNRPIDLQAWQP